MTAMGAFPPLKPGTLGHPTLAFFRGDAPWLIADRGSRLCDMLGAALYMPFASQAVFNRADSRWANGFRTSLQDLERYRQSRARLLPPYSTLDLADLSCESLPAERYAPAAT